MVYDNGEAGDATIEELVADGGDGVIDPVADGGMA